MAQISTQFTGLQSFLRVRDKELKEEVKEEERKALVPMQESLVVRTCGPYASVGEGSGGCGRARTSARPTASSQWDPTESHLQFFVWKEMLRIIKPALDFSMSHMWSSAGFQSGQHYWKVMVGERTHWSLGVDTQFDGRKQGV
ncbi:hypothetical protein AAFF_G00227440 [Aldrovandia affinis]|uniref:B30.2/SPRY domain-containing protein n=1 Tax=Aldrovandia affinis TaxID=143900 RepID=A0AAD7TBG1_9TELE|nr:hypothetical protein AAFF_G00227440 [Aldrovandia affinis]